MEKRKEIKKLMREVFEYYGKKKIEEIDFTRYFLNKGMTEREVDELWSKAEKMKLMKIGVRPISDPSDPLKILGHKIIFSPYNYEE